MVSNCFDDKMCQCIPKFVILAWIFLSHWLGVLSLEAQEKPAVTVAVLSFKNNTGLFSLGGLERSVPEMLKTELSRSEYLLVVERRKLDAILAEQALGQTGVIDDTTAQTVGKLAGAEYILTGEIGKSGSNLRIDCHILKVETGQVSGEKVIGRSEEVLDTMVRLLATNLIYNLTGEGKPREKIRLKSYPAKWFWLATLASAAATGVTHVVSHSARNDYESATHLDDIDTFYNRANRFRKTRNVLIIASGILAVTSTIFSLKNRSRENQVFARSQVHETPYRAGTFFCGRRGEVGVSVALRL